MSSSSSKESKQARRLVAWLVSEARAKGRAEHSAAQHSTAEYSKGGVARGWV